jgi:4-amino-4-deoxy-L-arabinose transferase-like glycosyltransferase
MFRRLLDKSHLHIPILLLICLILYFAFLGARDFWQQENDYAEVARIMLLEGNYALPTLNGMVWADNPPLFFWLALPLPWLAGQVNEWTMRLLPAFSGTALILFFYLFFRKKFGARMSFIAAVVLATSLLTIHVERHIPINMVFFLFVVLAMFCLMEVLVFDSTRWAHVYGAWFFLALACLTKGPFIILFPATVVGLYLSLSGNWKKFAALCPFTGVLLFLGVAAPWFVYAMWKTSGGWAHAFYHHQHVRYFKGRLIHDLQAVYYSALNFPVYFLPWSFLLAPALINLWPERAKARDGAALFLLLWALSILLFYPFYGEEHSHYLFLALLPAALAIGIFFDRMIFSTSSDSVRGWTRGCLISCCCFLVVAGIALPVVASLQWHDQTWRTGAVGAGFIVGALWLAYAMRNRDYSAVAFGLAVLIIVTNTLVQSLVLPAANWLEGRPFAEKVGDLVSPGAQVAIYSRTPLQDFNFYSRIKRFEVLRKPKEVTEFLSRPGPHFLLLTKRNARKIQETWPGDLNVVFTQAAGGGKWWYPPSGRWLLLHSCNGKCESAPLSVQSDSPPNHGHARRGDGIRSDPAQNGSLK